MYCSISRVKLPQAPILEQKNERGEKGIRCGVGDHSFSKSPGSQRNQGIEYSRHGAGDPTPPMQKTEENGRCEE